MVAPRKYPDELRERAVRLTVEARHGPGVTVGCVPADRRATRDQPRDAADVGRSGRGRGRWWSAGIGERGDGPGHRAREREPRTAPLECDSA